MSKPASGWWATVTEDGCVEFDVQTSIYPIDALSRTAHEFSGRAYVLIRSIDPETARVILRPMDRDETLTKLVGDFSNTLLDHKLRIEIGNETRAIRELLVAQAFVEADLLDRTDSQDTLDDDPRRLRTPR